MSTSKPYYSLTVLVNVMMLSYALKNAAFSTTVYLKLSGLDPFSATSPT